MQRTRGVQTSVTRSNVLNWVNAVTGCHESRIQDLGTGVAYCLLLNHYYPNTISQPKQGSRSPHDFCSNLKKLQEAFTTIGITHIPINAYKLSQMHYQDNWILILKMYKFFHSNKGVFKIQNKQSMRQSMGQKQSMRQNMRQSMKQSLNFHFDQSIAKVNQRSAFNTPTHRPFGDMQNQSTDLIEEIKKIINSAEKNDKVKVKILKKKLGIFQQQQDLKQLLSEYKQIEQIDLQN